MYYPLVKKAAIPEPGWQGIMDHTKPGWLGSAVLSARIAGVNAARQQHDKAVKEMENIGDQSSADYLDWDERRRTAEKDLQAAGDNVNRFVTDVEAERKLDSDFSSALKERGSGYAWSAGGGALVGALLAGRGNRMLGGMAGLLAVLGLNYLRRKSYYGSNVNW